ncbi:hypothetical protein [Stenotrophomonas sp. NLF4-10]|uniref:hypothetical protein n=1 Tax=Stenotrophomonas sp. NLF4-10 TaxID=2918754 RepID=UPI001EFBA690|nr:hypothetical protein [Stenotrophomonas sp. NLF4-10]MCG8275419.1 hypothetical protein [Stenotrophomonas sp. NLF4-10]
MTVFRILPNGARRRLPGGSVRALGANGSRYFDVAGSTSLGVDTGGAALPVVPMVGQTWLSFALAGSLTQAGTVGRTVLSIGIAGALSGNVNLRGAALLGIDLLGVLTPAQRLRGSTGMQFTAAGCLLPSVPMRGAAGIGVDVIGQLAVAAVLRGRLDLGIRVSGLLTAKAGQKWRDLWTDVYDKRQTLLNAIDANNRNLAKEAGVLASANATAIVQTNTRVEAVEGTVTAEAQRVTLLTGRVDNVEGTQTAQGTAISNLQTTQTSQGNTLTSHSQQLVSVQSSITTLDGQVIANANATTALDSRVSVNEAGVAQAKASWGVYLTAGNVISGVQSINNGVIAEFNVMAHVFRLLSPAGADGMEIQDGYIRIWKGNSQTIIGNNFGVAGQKLMRWFGPNIGAANCTKANAMIWEDSDGNAYFGGQVLQGVLRFFNSTTSTSSSASVATGQNNSNGKPKAVSARMTFDAFQSYPNLTGQITPGSGVTSAVVVIERQYSGGSWTELGRRTLIGQSDYERSDASFISWTLDGSLTVTDADGSTAARSYRARVLSRSQKPYSVTNPGTTPAVVLAQYLSIESME